MDGFSGSEVSSSWRRRTARTSSTRRCCAQAGFDRTITVSPSDQKGRVEILRVHTRNVPLADDVDLTRLARSTSGMTGASSRTS
jgi:cell division protease FtsH